MLALRGLHKQPGLKITKTNNEMKLNFCLPNIGPALILPSLKAETDDELGVNNLFTNNDGCPRYIAQTIAKRKVIKKGSC